MEGDCFGEIIQFVVQIAYRRISAPPTPQISNGQRERVRAVAALKNKPYTNEICHPKEVFSWRRQKYSGLGARKLCAYRSERIAESLTRVEGLRFEVLDFDHEDARTAGELRAALAKSGTPIGPYDTLIAGQAKARELILITRNVREFERVGGLRVECW